MAPLTLSNWKLVKHEYPAARWAEPGERFRAYMSQSEWKRFHQDVETFTGEPVHRQEAEVSVTWDGHTVTGVRIGQVAGWRASLYCNFGSSDLLSEESSVKPRRDRLNTLFQYPMRASHFAFVPSIRPREDRWAHVLYQCLRQPDLVAAISAYLDGGAEPPLVVFAPHDPPDFGLMTHQWLDTDILPKRREFDLAQAYS